MNKSTPSLLLIGLIIATLLTACCSPKDSSPPPPEPSPAERASQEMVAAGRALRKLDGISVEQAAEVPQAARRERLRGSAAEVERRWSMHYHRHLELAALLPKREVADVLAAQLSEAERTELFPLMRQHLGLAHARVTPRPSELAQDFRLLRFDPLLNGP
jgi:hypothetical protein